MAKRKRPKVTDGLFGKKKITPAFVIGLIMGAAIIGLGFFTALAYDQYGGYFAAAMGALFMILVYVAAR